MSFVIVRNFGNIQASHFRKLSVVYLYTAVLSRSAYGRRSGGRKWTPSPKMELHGVREIITFSPLTF